MTARKPFSKNRCVWCGDSFRSVLEYEEHLEVCDANPQRKQSAYLAQRLHEAAEDMR